MATTEQPTAFVRRDHDPPARRGPARRDVIVAGTVLLVSILIGGWGALLRRYGVPLLLGHGDLLAGAYGVRGGFSTGPVVALGVVMVGWGPAITQRLSWRRLLILGAVTSAVWSTLLALVDGVHKGLIQPLVASGQYENDVPRVHGVASTLRGFTDHILSTADPWTTHVAGHPPGALLTFWALHRIGLGAVGFAAALCIAGGALAVPAVLLVARDVAGAAAARAAAPFLVALPAVLWIAVSADAWFLGVTAWGIAALSAAACRTGIRSDLLAVAGGLLLGCGIFLSYGLVLLAPLAIAVVAVRRRVRPLLVGAVAVTAVVATFAAAGFWWFDGLTATRERVHLGAAGARPYYYFVVADLAILAIALGPAVLAGLGRVAHRPAGHGNPRSQRGLMVLVAAAGIGLLVADLSGLARGEVERVWLPFMPWLAVAAALLPRRDVRWWLAAQVIVTIAIQTFVVSPW